MSRLDPEEIIRVIERVKIELLYTRSILRTQIDHPKWGNKVSGVLSRCTDTVTEVELLIAAIRERR
jgi:hypothetical protein